MPDFHEILFPVDISYGSHGGPKWKTAVWQADSGFEARVSDWETTRAEYDISHGIKDQRQMDALTAFFYARRGRAYGFRFKDWNDYTIEDAVVGYGDYATRDFQITKEYDSPDHDGGSHKFVRTLKKIAWESETGVAVDGVAVSSDIYENEHYEIDYDTGILSLSFPMSGDRFDDVAPYSQVDYITTGEGGIATSYSTGTIVPTPCLDLKNGYVYLRGTFSGSGTGVTSGIRRINLNTGAEDLQRRNSTMGLTNFGTGNSTVTLSTVNCVDGQGYIYLVRGGTTEGQDLWKIDPATYTQIAHWGATNTTGPSATAVGIPEVSGAVSLDDQTFTTADRYQSGGLINIHSCATLERLYTVSHGTVGLGVLVGVSPYQQSGFAIVSNNGDPETPCKLTLYLGNGVSEEVFQFGQAGSRARWFAYDRYTGGILLCWQNGSNPLDMWCGLWHADTDGFVWQRRMPETIGSLGTSWMSCAIPLSGQMAWVYQALFFGESLWILNTVDGSLQSRESISGVSNTEITGIRQVYDPTRRLVAGFTGGVDRVVSASVSGASMQSRETLTIASAEFHVPVRFDTDHLNAKHEFWNTQSWDSIPLVEVRDWSEVDLD